MSKPARWVYCWDSSVWLAWLKQEACHPLADIEVVATEITAGRADFLVPATVYEELHLTRCTPAQLKTIEGFLKRSNVLQVTQPPAVGRKAAQIINLGAAAGIVTRMNDARIIASSIVFGATVLQSVDQKMLRLDGQAVVEALRIKKPGSLSGQFGLC